MEEDRIARALARIEAAADRIAAARIPTGGASDAQLEHKYESLRREAGAALAELDRLIGSLDA